MSCPINSLFDKQNKIKQDKDEHGRNSKVKLDKEFFFNLRSYLRIRRPANKEP